MKCLAVVLCRTAMTDKETGLVSYVQSFNDTLVPALPASLPPFWMGTVVERTSSGDPVRLRIMHRVPGGETKEMLRTDTMELPVGVSRLNFSFGQFQPEQEGRHEFVLEYSDGCPWALIGTAPLYIKVSEPK